MCEFIEMYEENQVSLQSFTEKETSLHQNFQFAKFDKVSQLNLHSLQR